MNYDANHHQTDRHATPKDDAARRLDREGLKWRLTTGAARGAGPQVMASDQAYREADLAIDFCET